MINIFFRDSSNRLIKNNKPIEKKSILESTWIDLYNPTKNEKNLIKESLGIDLPSRSEMNEIEPSNRFYENNGACFLTATVITNADSLNPEIHVILFILKDEKLLVLRHSDPSPIHNFIEKILADHSVTAEDGGSGILKNLLEAIISRIADILESLLKQTMNLSSIIIGSSKKNEKDNLNKVLDEIKQIENLLSKSYQSLNSLLFFIDFIHQSTLISNSKKLKKHEPIFKKDINALIEHVNFISKKLGFLLDSTLGMINIEQNQIIKMFTVLALVFMPPTLIASMYGMNFHFMPELSWKVGYPFAIIMMILSSLLPYRFFRRKGWI